MPTPFEIVSIDHVNITVPKDREEEARYFYGEVLGLVEIPKPPAITHLGGNWYQVGALQLHIGIEAHRPDTHSRRHIAFVVRGMEELKKYFTERGLLIFAEIEEGDSYRCSIRDPFGNRIEFIEKRHVTL
jgi:catechol 2,3-dioxygenase-like lactoylglutathione lyase family enzyme